MDLRRVLRGLLEASRRQSCGEPRLATPNPRIHLRADRVGKGSAECNSTGLRPNRGAGEFGMKLSAHCHSLDDDK